MSPAYFILVIFFSLLYVTRSKLLPAAIIPIEPEEHLTLAIIDGSEAPPSRYKWMASLQRSGHHMCGAVLLTYELVVSAAHCLIDPRSKTPMPPDELTILVGSHELTSSGLLMHVANFTLHPSFSSQNPTLESDIAVIRLKNGVPEGWRENTEHIFLPFGHHRYGPILQAVGWGYTDSQSRVVAQTLRAVNLTEIDAIECRARFDDGIDITRAILCTDSSNGDICQGDSGGPLISDTDPVSGYHIDTLVGIISMSSHRCGMNASASLHTNVSHFLDFLHAEMGPTEVNRSRRLFLEKTNWSAVLTNEGTNHSTVLVQQSDDPQSLPLKLIPTIRGGTNADPGIFKWMVSLQRYGQHLCGGVLITDELVVTAAHCLFFSGTDLGIPYEELSVLVGIHNLKSFESDQKFHVIRIHPHPKFRPYIRNENLDFDIATLRLHRPIPEEFRYKVSKIDLPTAFEHEQQPLYGRLRALGWGRNGTADYPNILQTVWLSEISREECQTRQPKHNVTEEILCIDSSGKDICQGDSGGPLVLEKALDSGATRYVLIGIVSMSSGCDSEANGSASIFTRVSRFVPFIENEKFIVSLETHRKNHPTTIQTPAPTPGPDDELAVDPGEDFFPAPLTPTEDDEISTTTTQSPPVLARIRTSSVVSIRIKGQPTRHVCTGTLISVDRVLTAASCLYDELDKPITASRLIAVVGLDVYSWHFSSQEIAVTSIVTYKGFVPSRFATHDVNVAVLRLASSIADLPDSVRDTIAVAEFPFDESKTGDYLQGSGEHGYWLMSIGWNGDAYEAPKYPRSKNQTILPIDSCLDRVKDHFTRLNSGVICTEGVVRPCNTNLHPFAPTMPRVSFAADMGSPLMAVRIDPDSGAVIETVLGVTTIFTDQCSKTRTHAPITNIYVRVSGPIRKFVDQQLQSGIRQEQP